MRLIETDWDAPGGASPVEVEYPDAVIAEFMNWIRRTTAWLESPELVERRVRRLNAVLMDHRNAAALAKAKDPTQVRLANLAKANRARAVKAAARKQAAETAT